MNNFYKLERDVIRLDTIENIINNPDFGIKLLQNLKDEQEKNRKLEKSVGLKCLRNSQVTYRTAKES